MRDDNDAPEAKIATHTANRVVVITGCMHKVLDAGGGQNPEITRVQHLTHPT